MLIFVMFILTKFNMLMSAYFSSKFFIKLCVIITIYLIYLHLFTIFMYYYYLIFSINLLKLYFFLMCLHKFTHALKKCFITWQEVGVFVFCVGFVSSSWSCGFPSGASAARLFPSAFGLALPNEFTRRAKNTRPKEALACFKLPVAF